jgi:hypothetical protein
MNWGEIKAAVKGYLENEETSFVANLPLFAHLAEEDIYRKVQLQFTKDTAVTQTTAGDNLLYLPGNAVSVYTLRLSGPVFATLLAKDEAFLNEIYPDATDVGTPRFYAYRNETDLLLAPTPDDYYNVEMHYFRKPPSITSGSPNPDAYSNWLSQNGENALLFGILMHGYIYEKGDQDVIQMYGKQFEVAVQDLKLIAEGRQKKDTYRTPDQRMPT